MAKTYKGSFRTLTERPLSEVGTSQAALDFDKESIERSIRNAAERLGTTPDALKKEAKEKGVNPLDLIKDKEKGASTVEEKPAESAKSPAKNPVTVLKESPPPAPAAKAEETAADTETKALTEADEERIQKAKDKRSRKADIQWSQELGFSSDEIKKIAKKMGLPETAVRANLGNQDFAARAVKVLNEPDGGVSVPTRSTINVVKPPTTESAATDIPESSPAPDETSKSTKSPAKKSVTVLKESPPPEPTKSDSKKPVSKPRKRKTAEEKRTKIESTQQEFARQQLAAEGEAPKTPTPDIDEDQKRFGREQMAASGETPAPSPKPIAAEQQAAGAAASRVERTVQANQEKERQLAKESAEAKKAVEAEFKKITPTVVESAAKQAGVETSAVQKVVTEALETAAKQGKSAGEALEQVAKRIPDKRTKAAIGIIAAGLTAVAGYMASNKNNNSNTTPAPNANNTPAPNFTEEEGNKLREEYDTIYSRLEAARRQPTLTNPNPKLTEEQKKGIENEALLQLSQKFQKSTLSPQEQAATIDWPMGQRRPPSSLGSKTPTVKPKTQIPMAKVPTIEFPEVRSLEEIETQLKVLQGELKPGLFEPGRMAYGALKSAENTPENREAVQRRIAQLNEAKAKAGKYSAENISRFLGKAEKPAETPAAEAPAEKPAETPAAGKKVPSDDAVEDATKQNEDSLTLTNKYVDNNTSGENRNKLQSTGQTLSKKLENAKKAYRKGVDNVVLMKALEKIAEGLALWGAGAYGMKHGVDAVSGLKFSPIDWSDKMKALEKELDLAESEYTKGIELEEKEKEEGIDIAEKNEKIAEKAAERAEKQKESGIKARIAEVESQIRNIEAARARGKDADYISTATTVGIPKESLTKETWMGLGGPAFNKDKAEAAFEKRQAELVKEKAELLKQLAGEEKTPAATTGGRTPQEEEEYQELLIEQSRK